MFVFPYTSNVSDCRNKTCWNSVLTEGIGVNMINRKKVERQKIPKGDTNVIQYRNRRQTHGKQIKKKRQRQALWYVGSSLHQWPVCIWGSGSIRVSMIDWLNIAKRSVVQFSTRTSLTT